ncbi:MAG: ATP-binding protein, partial [Rhodocyclaceae bacterium]|nr:ATP-binding protein [Rhodocyclaceae bacterium]
MTAAVSAETLLLLVHHKGNRQLLQEWLGAHFRLLTADALAAGEEFNLCLVDAVALDQYAEALRRHKEKFAPQFVPVLLLMSRKDVGLATRQLWASVDELIHVPISRIELQARVHLLLQTRELSLKLKAALAEANAATQAKSQFLANMSHEIRTPLHAILGMAQLIEAPHAEEKRPLFVATLKNSARNLLAIINDILDFSKIEAGRIELERVEFDLRRLIDDALALQAPAAAEKGLELSATVAADLPARVVGDPTRLRQILDNLLANAVKFTQAGRVILRARCDEQAADWRIVFEIEDTGIGIPADRQAAIFESFSQADAGTTRRFGGTGLGLNIARELARLMGGEIRLTSAPGKG